MKKRIASTGLEILHNNIQKEGDCTFILKINLKRAKTENTRDHKTHRRKHRG